MKSQKAVGFIYLLFYFSALFMAGEVFASTLYVDTNGLDSNSGSIGSPFRTIQKAADVVGAGDRVIVKAGIYYERIQIKSSGTTGNPIVFEGELGSGGERLSIIDGSDVVTGWVTASEIGPGVYKTKSMNYEPYAMVIEENGETYDIAKLRQRYSSKGNDWTSYMNKGSNATEDMGGVTVNFWDGIEVLYSSNGASTYIRFRNYDNPNQKIVRSSRQGAAISLWGKSNVVVKNFKVRASHGGIDASPKGGNNPVPTSKITIENNEIINGARKISVVADDCIVRGNVMYMNGYAGYKTGHIPGPWLGTLNYESAVKKHLYEFYKYPVGYGTSPRDEEGIFLLRDGHKVYNNEIYETFQGIYVGSSNTEIYNNTIHDNSSIAFFFDGETGGVSNVSIYDNLIYKTNIAFRFGDFNKGNIQANIYRNKIWNPPGVGRSIYYHHDVNGGIPTRFSNVYWYHNSFSGGSEFLSVSDFADDWGWKTSRDVRYINNIISSPIFVNEWRAQEQSDFVELCEYNWVGSNGKAVWLGDTNIFKPGQLIWNSAMLHDFSSPNIDVIEAGIDLSSSFSIDGNTYAPFEGMVSGYFTGNGPDIGAVQSGSDTTSATRTVTVQNAENVFTLVGHWTFDEGAGLVAYDYSGNGNDGMLVNGAAWATGKIAGGLNFDGTDGYVNVGTDSSTDDIFSGGGTVAAWIYPRSVGEANYGRIFGKGKTNIHLRTSDGSTMKLGVKKEFSSNNGLWETSSRVITANEWNHVVVTYAQSASKDPVIYVNGVKQSVVEKRIPSGSAQSDASFDGIIGNDAAKAGGSVSSRTFDGLIDDFRLYNKVLSESEVMDIYSFTAEDPSVNTSPNGVIETPTGDLTINLGDSVNFVGTYSDPDNDFPQSLNWSFGAGSGIPDSTQEDPGLIQFNNPGSFIVTFTVTDAQWLSDSTPATRTITVQSIGDPNRYYWLEAETAESITSPMQVSNDGAASGGQYIWVPNGQGNDWNGSGAEAVYSVDITVEGEYVLWGRVIAPTSSDDSFFVKVGGSVNNAWAVSGGSTWRWKWDKVNIKSGVDPVKYYLTTGNQTIKIGQREDGTRLDKLLLTNDLSYVPIGIDSN